MILRTSPPSPFGRKISIAASVLGLAREIAIENADPADASETLRQQNPFGKIRSWCSRTDPRCSIHV
jgi:glutathione S-transferase